MRITWNENAQQFEAQFSTGDQWHADQTAASDAGFRTDGPPAWVWRATKAAVLDKLKANRPTSGLTITKVALDAYNHLRAIEDRDAELKKFAKEQKKLQKKAQEREKIKSEREDGEEISPEYEPTRYRPIPEYWKGKQEITWADLPADIMARHAQRESVPVRRAEPLGKCRICGGSTYDPDEFDFCLWCSGRGEENFLIELF